MSEKIRNVVDPVLFLIVLGLLWEWSVRFFRIKPYLFPTLSDVFAVLWNERVSMWNQGLITLLEVVVGFAAATVGGVIIALAIFFVPTVRRTVYPMITAMQSIPKVALAPLMVVWFGYGLSAKFVMAFLFAVFPIIIATLGGLAGTPQNLVEHFRALNASGWETIWRLRIPSALPSFIDGCKIAIPLAMIGAVVGEFIGSQNGLGYVILVSSSTAQTAQMFAALITIAVLSWALFLLMELISKLVWWRAV
ncbi:MAG: ABC transporter permease [Alphaproteobacteria bacterium]|nr:ABC transporter permease [Alphaproteobacteria bacterium]